MIADNPFAVDVVNVHGLAQIHAVADAFEDALDAFDDALGGITQGPTARLRAMAITKLQEAYLIARHAIGTVPEYRAQANLGTDGRVL